MRVLASGLSTFVVCAVNSHHLSSDMIQKLSSRSRSGPSGVIPFLKSSCESLANNYQEPITIWVQVTQQQLNSRNLKGAVEVSFLFFGGMGGIPRVRIEHLLGARSHAARWHPEVCQDRARPGVAPVQRGRQTHTPELQVRWSWHQAETSAEAGGNTEAEEMHLGWGALRGMGPSRRSRDWKGRKGG